jgi:hypothetical protein
LNPRKIQNRFGRRKTIGISNAPQCAIRVAMKIAHGNRKQTAAETLAHLTGCLTPRRTLKKQRQSNNRHRVRRAFCERTDYRRLRIRWMV